MSDMEEIIARAIRDTHGTPADIAQALTQAGYGRVDVAPTSDEPTQPVPDELVEAVRALLLRLGECSHTDHAGNCQSHFIDPSGSCPVSLVRTALSLPRKTEAEIRADERDRLLCLALGSEEDDYYARDGYVAEWLRSQTQGEE